MELFNRRWGYTNQRLFLIKSPAIVARFGSPTLKMSYLMMPDRNKVAVSIILGDLSFITRDVAERMFRGIDSDFVFAFGKYDERITDYEITVDYAKSAHPLSKNFMVIEGLTDGMVSLADDEKEAPPFGVITTQSILWLYSYFMKRSLSVRRPAIVV